MNLQDLPCEILTLVAGYLPSKEVLRLMLTSTVLYSTFENQTFWKVRIAKNYPGEVNLGIAITPEPNYKEMYIDLCKHIYFMIVISWTNLDILSYQRSSSIRFGLENRFSIFLTGVSYSKKSVYNYLKRKMTPPENKVLITETYRKRDTLNYALYLTKEDVNELFSEESKLQLHKISMNKNTHCTINYTLFGKKLRKGIKNVYVFVSVCYYGEGDVQIEYIDFFESLEDIEKWMESGNLEKASSVIKNTGEYYEVDSFYMFNKMKHCISYSNLTKEIMKNLGKGKDYVTPTSHIKDKHNIFTLRNIRVANLGFPDYWDVSNFGVKKYCFSNNGRIIIKPVKGLRTFENYFEGVD